jgi:hypothetical protein
VWTIVAVLSALLGTGTILNGAIPGLQMSSVVRSAVKMTSTVETWRAAMLEKGWS